MKTCQVCGWRIASVANCKCFQKPPTTPPAADVQELVEALRLMIDSHTEGGFPSATVVIAQAALAKWEGK